MISRWLVPGVCCLASLLLTPSAAAQYDLTWFTIDGGGAMFTTGGSFELSGTIGQPDAGATMTGGTFELTGGFWVVTAAAPCPEDLTGDGVVNQADLALLLSCYNVNACGDVTGDGLTDQADLAAVLAVYGLACP